MRRQTFLSFAALAALLVAPLAQAQTAPQRWITVADDFQRGSGGWLADFADYSFAHGGMRRLAEVEPLPPEVNPEGDRSGYVLQSQNTPDDLFMFLKKPLSSLDGVVPGASYRAEFFLELASDAPSGCVGIGGAPGESVYLKVGLSATEPVGLLEEDGQIRLNLDKGGQSQGGADATLAGDVANGAECTDENRGVYRLIERRQTHGSTVRAGPSGDLWLYVGTDSGFEGLTRLYYSRIVVSLERLDAGDAR